MRFVSHGATHVGLVRKNNEDALFVNNEARLWAVADGIGGGPDGEVASALCIEGVRSSAGESSAWPLVEGAFDGARRLLEAVEYARRTRRRVSMGSTLVVASERRGVLCVGSVGDSRAYRRARDGLFEQLTTDESVGVVLHNWMGPGRSCLPTLTISMPRVGDRYLLCTDGLSNMVNHREIQRIMGLSLTPEELCKKLLVAAMVGGGQDNVTVVVIDAVE